MHADCGGIQNAPQKGDSAVLVQFCSYITRFLKEAVIAAAIATAQAEVQPAMLGHMQLLYQ